MLNEIHKPREAAYLQRKTATTHFVEINISKKNRILRRKSKKRFQRFGKFLLFISVNDLIIMQITLTPLIIIQPVTITPYSPSLYFL